MPSFRVKFTYLPYGEYDLLDNAINVGLSIKISKKIMAWYLYAVIFFIKASFAAVEEHKNYEY